MRGGWANISKNRLIFVAISVLTFCTVWIGYGLLESAKYDQQAKDKLSEYTEYTRDKVAQACAGGDKSESIKCVTEAFEAKREYEYNQSDLVAQRQSALWAYIMAAAAVFGIALSAVGVWLVKTTFDETRKANEIAKASQRPWLSVQIIPKSIKMTDNGYAIFVDVLATNIGQIAARNYAIACHIFRVDRSLEECDGRWDRIYDFWRDIFVGRDPVPQVLVPTQQHCWEHWEIGFSLEDVFASAFNGERFLDAHFAVCCQYTSSLDDVRHNYQAVYSLHYKEENGEIRGIMASEIPISVQRLTARPIFYGLVD